MNITRLKSKDEATYVHSLAVSGLMTLLAASLNLDEEMISVLALAGLLHDIGKLKLPNKILNKPGELTTAERNVVRHHPDAGYQILRAYSHFPREVLDVCLLHHEVLDGSGYPRGLKQKDLTLPVQISTVCDVFEALTSFRPYKHPWTNNQALDWMFARPHLFDCKLIIRLGSVLVDQNLK